MGGIVRTNLPINKKTYMIKKVISIISIAAALLPSTFSCKKQETKTDIPVQSISLDKTTLTMDLHDEASLTASVLPENATNKSVTWSSTDERIVNVNGGRVKAVGYGETSVFAVSADGNVKAECKVSVRKIAPVSIKFEKSLYETEMGLTLRIMPKVEPENFPLDKLIWESSDEAIAKVNQGGHIHAIKGGSCDIKAGIYGVKSTFRLRVKRDEIPEGAVDLGLPSCNLWAKYNIGATDPYKYGGLYSWGELEEKPSYVWDKYKFGIYGKITKYFYNGPGILQKEDDIANVKLGGTWYIPKYEEFKELLEHTEKSWVENYLGKGIAGFIFKSKVEGYEANSIFFPAAGRKSDSKREFEKYNAFLWTSQNGRGYSLLDHEAKAMNFQVTGTENKVHTDARAYDRNTGLSIRPVNRPE